MTNVVALFTTGHFGHFGGEIHFFTLVCDNQTLIYTLEDISLPFTFGRHKWRNFYLLSDGQLMVVQASRHHHSNKSALASIPYQNSNEWVGTK